MRRRSLAVSTVLAVIALVLLPAISNIEANAVPASWTRYLWVAWPAGLLLAAPLVYLDARQRQRERSAEEHGGASEERRRRLNGAADALAAAVHLQWTEEKRLRSLDHPVPLQVRWASTTRPVAAPLAGVVAPGAVPSRPLAVRGDGTAQMAAVLGAVRDRQLVVLGAPGAGKSALALLFVLYQLEQRGRGDPVAVLLTVSSWDPRAEHLDAWLARRITEDYPGLGDKNEYGVHAPKALVAEGRVMAVLDGLDELPAPLRPLAIAVLDRAAAPAHPLVVTFRSADYEAAVTGGDAFLSRAAVLEIQPLDLAAADTYLTATRPAADGRWRAVLEELRVHPDAPLARVLTSPLMVALARSAYGAPASTPLELLEHPRFSEEHEIERHLFNAFVSAAYRGAPTGPTSAPPLGRWRYPPSRARAWLVFLACHLDRLDTGDLAWWQLVDAMPRTALGLYTALPVGLIFGASGVLASGPLVGLVLTLVFGAAAALASAFARPPAPARVQLRFRATALPFLRTFTGGCTVGLGLALALRQPILPAIASGLVIGLAFACRVWLDVPSDAAEVPTPRISLTQDRTASVAFAVTMALSLGFVSGMGFTVSSGLSLGAAGPTGLLVGTLGGAAAGGAAGYVAYGWAGCLAFAMAASVAGGLTFAPGGPAHGGIVGPEYGFVFALAAGVAGVLSRPWGQFTLARLWLATRGRLPWRFMDFLDNAHRRGVLRQSGAVYEFRHATLRDHLAHIGRDGERPTSAMRSAR